MKRFAQLLLVAGIAFSGYANADTEAAEASETADTVQDATEGAEAEAQPSP